jgi:1-acyl-sn-glycerol-3-phosphate acyltransferase
MAERMPERSSKSLALSLHNIYETLAISWPTVIDAARRRVTKAECDERLARWSSNIVHNAKIDLHVVGRENLEPGHTYLVMSNHQSLYDIPVLFHVIGANLRMVTKTELFKIPIFGDAMAAAGFISIDRSNRQRAIESLAVARRKLHEGTHVWIAPEGTRSKTGKLLPFKKGGFQLALETLQPILPVTLRGTRDVLPAKGARSYEGASVTVTLHRPLDPKGYAGASEDDWKEGRKRMMADVRTALEAGL